ncbi:MAG: hypothetical protein OK452_09920 [Thaumarchaeota archaeon]|nr:hypothetical protein [Nitrososphaerota archaeon]
MKVVILNNHLPGLSELVNTCKSVGCIWPRTKVPSSLPDEFRRSTFNGIPYDTTHNSSPVVYTGPPCSMGVKVPGLYPRPNWGTPEAT